MYEPIVTNDIPKTNPWIKRAQSLGYKYIKDVNIPATYLENNVSRRKSAFELLNSQKQLSTSIDELDTLLEGGLQYGQIVELSGAPGSGKTQLCYKIAINLLANNVEAEVLYLSTNSNYSLVRLREISQQILSINSQKQSESDIKNILDRIKVIDIESLTDLLATIKYLKSTYLLESKLHLLIIDNIFIPLKTISFKEHNQIIYRLFNELQCSESDHEFVILLTNSQCLRFKGPNESYVTSCLGSTYYHRLNIRILLSRNQHGKRFAQIIKCPLISSQKSILFEMN